MNIYRTSAESHRKRRVRAMGRVGLSGPRASNPNSWAAGLAGTSTLSWAVPVSRPIVSTYRVPCSDVEIQGTNAIVFGGASGLGEATARRLAAEGAHVTIADLDEERAAQVAADIDGTAIRCDVADPESVKTAVDRAGELRISVTCAGVATPGKLIGRDGPTPLDAFAKVININLLGTINTLRLAAGAMVKNAPTERGERGVCVNTASIAAYDGQIGQVAYAASKGGVVALTLPVARELAGKGVRVVTIAPGLFETPLLAGLPQPARESLAATVPFPPRLGDPADYADLVEHIVTNTMLNGEVIRLDGALRMAPR